MAKAAKKSSRTAAAKPAKRTKAITTKLTKTQLIHRIAEDTGVAKKDIAAIFESLGDCVRGQMTKRGFGEITLPGVGVKIRRVRKPATKKRTMISPFDGKEIVVAAKPARNVVKVSALKALKESVG